jgi:hypothetical protein
MGRAAYLRLPQASFSFLLLTACLLCVTGCHNSCVTGTLTSANVQASNPPPSCTLNTANGIVRMEIGAASGVIAPSASSFPAPHIAHLFVTIAGVEVHSSSLANDDTPGWQPLAAELPAHPLQIDFLADSHANRSAAPFPDALVPAGVYRQIRLRLATAPAQEFALVTSPCVGSPHCAVMSDGRVRPVAFPSSRPELRIVLDGTSVRELYVPPDGSVTLAIELDRDRSWAWPSASPSGDPLLLHPVFRLSIQSPPDSD